MQIVINEKPAKEVWYDNIDYNSVFKFEGEFYLKTSALRGLPHCIRLSDGTPTLGSNSWSCVPYNSTLTIEEQP